jgi:hypothetical protein
MKEPYAVWPQMTVRQLPAGVDHRCSPKLDLVPIRHPLEADVVPVVARLLPDLPRPLKNWGACIASVSVARLYT